jgi:DNA-binding NarL/FixJ family response regulator
MHATAERQRALQLLRACGIRTWHPGRRPADNADQLTDRERAVVQMIRAGASNPEIAEALFISRKTVERHVSNALAKTNTRNRAELAARAEADPPVTLESADN